MPSNKYYSIIAYLLTLVFFCSFTFTIKADNSVRLVGLRIKSSSEKSTLIFDLTKNTEYKFFTLKNPFRFVIDLNNVRLATSLDHPALLNSIVKRIRSSKHAEKLRVVLDLKESVHAQVSLLAKPSSSQKSLVVHLFREKNEISRDPASNLPPVVDLTSKSQPKLNPDDARIIDKKKTDLKKHPENKVLPKPKLVSPTLQKKNSVVVVIDPGHGGQDPGTIGSFGTKEKNLVFAMAKELQKLINREKGFRAYLTRDRDNYVNLRNRLHIAHKKKADLFISIHADACILKKDLRGLSIYALSERGATSELARWLAKKENESELGNIIADKDLLLKTVLIDLAQTLTISNSVMLGNTLLQHLSKVTQLHRNRVEQAAFVVLKAPDIPSLLVELGFLSTPEEENRLLDASYRQKIAQAMVKGIKDYFSENTINVH